MSMKMEHKLTGFPLERENLGKWEGIFQSRKIAQITGKVREFPTNVIYYFLVIFK